MKKVLIIIILLIICVGAWFFFAQEKNVSYNINMKVESTTFKNNEEISSKYTCDGENINPELVFKDVPEEAKSLALIMDDPDAPRGTWDHWILWNISPQTTNIGQNSIPLNATVGLNSSDKNEYQGPCPPSGSHRYFFKLYALDTLISLKENTNKKYLLNAMKEHILAEAELIGKYKRNN